MLDVVGEKQCVLSARADLNAPISTSAPCVNRVQPEPAASQFSKHSLLITFALSAACGGVRRPVGGSMRSYVRNTKSADAVVPMVLDKPTPASAATVQMLGSCTTRALSRQELEKWI